LRRKRSHVWRRKRSSTPHIREEEKEQHHTHPRGGAPHAKEEEERHHTHPGGRGAVPRALAHRGERVAGAPHAEEKELELLHFWHFIGDGKFLGAGLTTQAAPNGEMEHQI
jgi:hypothetical protein